MHNLKNYLNNNYSIEAIKTPNKKLPTEYLKTIKNGWQDTICWNDSAKNKNKGVFKGIKSLKGKTREYYNFNVCTSLIKEKLKIIPKDKTDKARKFAYSLFSKNLTNGYSSSLSKHELAKQFIFHATTWKPTKVGVGASDAQQIDIALSVAWNAVIKGEWQEPLEWAKAKALQYEFLDHKRKYRESGIVSNEIRSLESIINNLLEANYDLTAIILKEVKELKIESVKIKENGEIEEGSKIKESKEIDVRTLDGVRKVRDRASDTEPPFFPKSYFNTRFFVKQDEFLSDMEECQSVNDLEPLSNIAKTTDNALRKINQRPITVTYAENYPNGLYKLNKNNVTAQTMSRDFYNESESDCGTEMGSNILATCYETDDDELLLKSDQNWQQREDFREFHGIDNRPRLSLKAEIPLFSLALSDVDSQSPKKYNDKLQLTLSNVNSKDTILDNVCRESEFRGGDLCLELHIATQEELLAKNDKHISKDFVKIDRALTEILKGLKREN